VKGEEIHYKYCVAKEKCYSMSDWQIYERREQPEKSVVLEFEHESLPSVLLNKMFCLRCLLRIIAVTKLWMLYV
jgi:hypothetical protein